MAGTPGVGAIPLPAKNSSKKRWNGTVGRRRSGTPGARSVSPTCCSARRRACHSITISGRRGVAMAIGRRRSCCKTGPSSKKTRFAVTRARFWSMAAIPSRCFTSKPAGRPGYRSTSGALGKPSRRCMRSPTRAHENGTGSKPTRAGRAWVASSSRRSDSGVRHSGFGMRR